MSPAIPLPEASGFPDDPPSPRPSRLVLLRRRISRRAIVLTAIGVSAYLLTLLVTLPAAFVVPRSASILGLSGTVWHGQAALAGGDRLEWRWAPLRSLANLAAAADFTVTGDGTEFGGRILASGDMVRLDDVTGTGDARLLRALAPNLPFACAIPLSLDLDRVQLGGGERRLAGRIVSEGGSCAPRAGGVAVPVGPLALTSEHLGQTSSGSIAPAAQRRRALATFTLAEDGRLVLTLTRDGAAALPFAGPPTGLTIEDRL